LDSFVRFGAFQWVSRENSKNAFPRCPRFGRAAMLVPPYPGERIKLP
jgi:hypothetical protein